MRVISGLSVVTQPMPRASSSLFHSLGTASVGWRFLHIPVLGAGRQAGVVGFLIDGAQRGVPGRLVTVGAVAHLVLFRSRAEGVHSVHGAHLLP